MLWISSYEWRNLAEILIKRGQKHNHREHRGAQNARGFDQNFLRGNSLPPFVLTDTKFSGMNKEPGSEAENTFNRASP